MTVPLTNFSGQISLNCGALTGGTDQSAVIVTSVSIEAFALDNIAQS